MPNDLLLSHAAEYNLLFNALPVAIKRLRELIQHLGGDSPAYVSADREVSRILARLRELANVPMNAPSKSASASSTVVMPSENAWAT